MNNLIRQNFLVRLFFLPLSFIYRILTDIRNLFFKFGIFNIKRFDVPIISVGNITTGGTGKTPVVMALIDLLKNDFSQIIIISRGYKRKTRGLIVVSNGKGNYVTAEEGGDEPVLIARKYPGCPVIVSEKRSIAIEKAIELYNPDLIILDDAFQHRWVHRNCDIVLIKAQTDLRDERLLPIGSLRESLKNLNRSDLIVITNHRTDSDNKNTKYLKNRFSGPIFICETKPICLVNSDFSTSSDLSKLVNQDVIAFTGIADPLLFKKILIENNINIEDFIAYPDHHFYTDEDIRKIIASAEQNNCEIIITTEKDLVKLKNYNFNKYKFLGLSIKIDIICAQNLRQKILKFIDMKL